MQRRAVCITSCRKVLETSRGFRASCRCDHSVQSVKEKSHVLRLVGTIRCRWVRNRQLCVVWFEWNNQSWLSDEAVLRQNKQTDKQTQRRTCESAMGTGSRSSVISPYAGAGGRFCACWVSDPGGRGWERGQTGRWGSWPEKLGTKWKFCAGYGGLYMLEGEKIRPGDENKSKINTRKRN